MLGKRYGGTDPPKRLPVNAVYQASATGDSTDDEGLEKYFSNPFVVSSASSPLATIPKAKFSPSRISSDSSSLNSTSTLLNNRFFALIEQEDEMFQDLTSCDMVEELLEPSSAISPKSTSAAIQATSMFPEAIQAT